MARLAASPERAGEQKTGARRPTERLEERPSEQEKRRQCCAASSPSGTLLANIVRAPLPNCRLFCAAAESPNERHANARRRRQLVLPSWPPIGVRRSGFAPAASLPSSTGGSRSFARGRRRCLAAAMWQIELVTWRADGKVEAASCQLAAPSLASRWRNYLALVSAWRLHCWCRASFPLSLSLSLAGARTPRPTRRSQLFLPAQQLRADPLCCRWLENCARPLGQLQDRLERAKNNDSAACRRDSFGRSHTASATGEWNQIISFAQLAPAHTKPEPQFAGLREPRAGGRAEPSRASGQ